MATKRAFAKKIENNVNKLWSLFLEIDLSLISYGLIESQFQGL